VPIAVGTCLSNPGCAAAAVATGAAFAKAVGDTLSQGMRSRPNCPDQDPCDKLEETAIIRAKVVERHVYARPEHLHPGNCEGLPKAVSDAVAAGCGERLGVKYAIGVYNVNCVKDWSDRFPDHTPVFPPFGPWAP
jgi:hypothetical protein